MCLDDVFFPSQATYIVLYLTGEGSSKEEMPADNSLMLKSNISQRQDSKAGGSLFFVYLKIKPNQQPCDISELSLFSADK